LDQGGPGVFVSLIVVVIVVIAIVYLTMRWAPALPVMANEGAGWRQAMTRSWHLSGGNVWRIFGVVAFALLATAVLAAFVGQLLALLLVDVIGAALGLDPVVAESIALALATVLLASLAPVLTAVLYFDLRVRRDPADVEATPQP
jgi:membrane-anchored glycerophosphoryl diester phosphodiesterase (GDPDase)